MLYPYAEELLGVRDLSLEIERSLDALLGVIGVMEDDRTFAGAMAPSSPRPSSVTSTATRWGSSRWWRRWVLPSSSCAWS